MERPAGSGRWAAVSQDELRRLLKPLGIDTGAVDRFVVAQSRQAVDVADPLLLTQRLEQLLGIAHLQEGVQAQEAAIRQAGQQAEEQEQQVARCEEAAGGRCQCWAPTVRIHGDLCCAYGAHSLTLRTPTIGMPSSRCGLHGWPRH